MSLGRREMPTVAGRCAGTTRSLSPVVNTLADRLMPDAGHDVQVEAMPSGAGDADGDPDASLRADF